MTQRVNGPIREIVIVGGGTAGWLSAAYLNRALGPTVKISLIESSSVDPIGVGEATIPTLKFTLKFLGLREADWMPEVGATYKTAIEFVGWCDPEARPRESYWHPFTFRPEPHVLPNDYEWMPLFSNGHSILHYALERRLEGAPTPLAQQISPIPLACARKKAPYLDAKTQLATAYHVDAGLLAARLRKLATSRGVERVVDHVEDVLQDEQGFITAVRTRGGRTLTADFFVDCSGFRSLLLGQTLGEPFLGENDHLLCDSAVALSAKNDPENQGIKPFTTATALSAGWVWDIPLFHRNGCGYVYSSAFRRSDDAERELRELLGSRSDESTANHIKMRIGQSRNWWVKNCVAVGLSGSFIEPLESTGIFLIELGLALLVSLFPDRRFAPARLREYNAIMRDVYSETRDFIVLHYLLNKRKEEFWRAARADGVLTDTLRERIEFLRENLPVLDALKLRVFPPASYAFILDGCGALPRTSYPMLAHVGRAEGYAMLDEWAASYPKLVDGLPDHYEFLRDLREGRGAVANERW